MKIRSFLPAAAAALLLAAAPAQSQNFTLKVALFTPKVSTVTRWFEARKAELAQKSGGRLTLEMFYGASMGPMPRHYDLARTGVADMSLFQQGVTPGRFPLTEITHLPYLFPPGLKGSLVGAKVAADLKAKYFAPEHEKAGSRLLWVVFNRPSGVYDAKRPIRSLADLKGRRYRAPTPTDVLMMKALGAVPVGLPANLMAESLQKGTIDGVVTDPLGIFSFRLGSLVKYYSNMFNSVISFGLVINPKSYARLPSDLQALVDGMGTQASAVEMATMTWSDFPPFTKYLQDSKIETVPMDPAADKEMRAMAEKAAEQKLAEIAQKGLPARAVYGELKALSAKYAQE